MQMIELTVLVTWMFWAVLLCALSYFAIRQNVDGVIAYGVALIGGFSVKLSLIAAFILAIAFCTFGDRVKAAYSIFGFVIGLIFWVVLYTLLTSGPIAEIWELNRGRI